MALALYRPGTRRVNIFNSRTPISSTKMHSRSMNPTQSAMHCSKAIKAFLNLHKTTSTRQLSSTISRQAVALPITATGPPPRPPVPSVSQQDDRIERRRRHAEMLKQGKEIRANQQGKQSPLRKRFWKEVHVKDVPEGYHVILDSRPVRTSSKSILTIPSSKPHLANAIALEWDLLVSTQQALKNHNIPLTSMTARAQDVIEHEAQGNTEIREHIIKTLLRYLETDTLLCWAPERSVHDAVPLERNEERTESLRDIQIRTARPIVAFLVSQVWPGIEIRPALDGDSIVPQQQSEMTRSIIKGWISGLPAFELAALERGVLASKSLLVGTRLLIDWSEEFRELQRTEQKFGIEEAAQAASIEVSWQTGLWGEVEDTHDVDKEDLRRQLGSVVLLVSGHR
jgi:ATP synthase F1 complex assembly factor 2